MSTLDLSSKAKAKSRFDPFLDPFLTPFPFERLPMSKINIKALAIFILFCAVAIYSCTQHDEDPGSPVTLTSQDKLSFLVANSDLIALVTISGGIEKDRNIRGQKYFEIF